MFKGLRVGLFLYISISLYLYIGGVLFHVDWCIRLLALVLFKYTL